MVQFAVAGDGAVGKTSLILRLVNSSWEHAMVHSAYGAYECDITVNNEPMKVSFHDTAGEDDFSPSREVAFANADTILLCYSIISPPSFENITEKWLPEIKAANPKCKIILVATKADLRNEQSILERLNERGFSPIATKQGKTKAKSIGASFIETDKSTSMDDFIPLFTEGNKSKKKKNGCSIV